MSERDDRLHSVRARAEGWVNDYTATAVAMAIVASPIPGASTFILCGAGRGA